jgi:hypothetical protein
MDETIGFQCCICGKAIHEPHALSVAITLPSGGSQELFAHGACLSKALHPSVPFLADA